MTLCAVDRSILFEQQPIKTPVSNDHHYHHSDEMRDISTNNSSRYYSFDTLFEWRNTGNAANIESIVCFDELSILSRRWMYGCFVTTLDDQQWSIIIINDISCSSSHCWISFEIENNERVILLTITIWQQMVPPNQTLVENTQIHTLVYSHISSISFFIIHLLF